jgi:hypothetical protein
MFHFYDIESKIQWVLYQPINKQFGLSNAISTIPALYLVAASFETVWKSIIWAKILGDSVA